MLGGLRERTSTIPHVTLDECLHSASGKANLCSVHLAKGLDFSAIAKIACHDEVPLA